MSAPLNPAITLNKVTKLFGRFAALREVSADFYPGRVYAIFGENGAGKSTMLRIVAGLTKPTRGEISYHASTEAMPKSSIGYMAHASLLYDELSGLENLRYFGGLYGLRGDTHLQNMMQQVGLDPSLRRRIGDYSQGMRQRLSLARATLHDPAIILLDEPFSNLDATSATDIVSLLAKLRLMGKTILVVTHQAALLEGAADESILVSQGRVAAREPGIMAARTNREASQ